MFLIIFSFLLGYSSGLQANSMTIQPHTNPFIEIEQVTSKADSIIQETIKEYDVPGAVFTMVYRGKTVFNVSST